MGAILPPATLGILGGGQLGHMFVVAAKTMGYRVIVVDPDPAAPAARFADQHICSSYADQQALHYLAGHCAAVTTEFENVDADALRWLEQHITVAPSADCVAIAQDRLIEKRWINESARLPTAPWLALTVLSDLDNDIASYLPGIIKTARLGYDGRGQHDVATVDEVRDIWHSLGQIPCVLEKRLLLKAEVSVIASRTSRGDMALFPVAENVHRVGILDMSVVPARLDSVLLEHLHLMTKKLICELNYVGVLAVEYFVQQNHEIVINEIAPRPHNSGHYSLDACVTDQFQQQVRTLCGLPLGSTRLLQPCVMLNVLGDIWGEQGQEPPWQHVLEEPNAHLYLYGKTLARPKRKMGHVTVLSETVDGAFKQAMTIKQALCSG